MKIEIEVPEIDPRLKSLLSHYNPNINIGAGGPDDWLPADEVVAMAGSVEAAAAMFPDFRGTLNGLALILDMHEFDESGQVVRFLGF